MTVPKLYSTRLAHETDMCRRVSEQPLIRASDIVPSDPRLLVIGVFNPAFLTLDGRPALVVRIDERPRDRITEFNRADGKKTIDVIYLSSVGKLEIRSVTVPADFDQEREAILPNAARRPSTNMEPELYLSFMSHLRVAIFDRNRIVVGERPVIFPSDIYTQYGCEDPRATNVDGKACVTFSGIGHFGATGCLAFLSTHGSAKEQHVLLGPDNKHCTLFPRRIRNDYAMLTRPLTRSTVAHDGIWLMRAPDLFHWGTPTPLFEPRPSLWDSERVGPGPSPLELPEGWLVLYYGVDRDQSYHLGAAILDAHDPSRVIARTEHPVLSPLLDWERKGRRADTVFACGAQMLDDGETVRIYYGASDSFVGAADLALSTLRGALVPTRR